MEKERFIPDGWREVEFKDLYNFAAEGSTPSTANSEYYADGCIPFVKIEDTFTKYIRDTKSFITEKGLKSCSTWLIPVDNIIFTNGATIGNVAINKIVLCTKQGILGVIIKEKYDVEFIYYLLSHRIFQKKVHSREAGGTFATIILQNLDCMSYPEIG